MGPLAFFFPSYVVTFPLSFPKKILCTVLLGTFFLLLVAMVRKFTKDPPHPQKKIKIKNKIK
jgi:hypothetical protein